ncbi:MAG: hypothetical protein ACYC7D_13120 [Nitrososphaerales archaeon]
MSEFKLRILRNVGVAALVFTVVFSATLYASLNVSDSGLGNPSSTTTVFNSGNSTTTTFTSNPTFNFTSPASTIFTPSATTSCSSNSTNNYSLLPAGSVISKISIPSFIGGIAFDSDLNRFYVTGSNYFGAQGNLTNDLIQIDGTSNQLRNFTYVGNQPVDVAYDQDNGFLYVADYGSNSVAVVNATQWNTQIIGNVSVGTNPVKIAYDPFNKEIYVSNRGSGTISVINATSNTLKATIPIGGSPFEFAYDALNHNMYVTDGTNNVVTAINSTNNIFETINLGPGGGMITFDSSNSLLYETSFGGAPNVYAINSTGKVVANISAGYDLNAIGYDPANNDIYVTGNATGGFAYLISGSNNSIVSYVSGQGYIPEEIIPNSPLNTAMFMISGDDNVYVLSNFANRTLVSSTSTISTIIGTTFAGSTGPSWTGYQLSNGCTGTISASYSFPAGSQLGSQSMQPYLETFVIYSGIGGSAYSSCYNQNGTVLVNSCPGIVVSASPSSLNYYGGFDTAVQFTISVSSYAAPGAYLLTLPGIGCTTPILLMIGNNIPYSLPQFYYSCTTGTGPMYSFNPSVSLVGFTGFNQVEIPMSG